MEELKQKILLRVLEKIWELEKAEEFSSVREVIVFGSAARTEDFVPGLSDVDVLVVVESASRSRHFSFEVDETRVDISVYTIAELLEMAKHGSPLMHMLKYSIVLYSVGESITSRLIPRVTVYTLKVFRKSVFVALSLALQRFFEGDYRRSIRHIYNAIRHLLRYMAGLKGYAVPVSDKEVIESAPPELREFVKQLIKMKRSESVGEEDVAKALIKAFDAIVLILKLKALDVKGVVKAHRAEYVLSTSVCEEKGELVVRLTTLRENSIATLKYSTGGVEEVKTVVCSEG